MDNIIVITDNDFNFEYKKLHDPTIRMSARGIVFNNGKVAVQKNKKGYKLVGGGIEDGETPEEAFKREVLEETGCKIYIDKFIGILKEERTYYNFVQVSYVYIAHVINDTKHLNLTDKELAEGAKLLWLDIDDIVNKLAESEKKLNDSFNGEDLYFAKFVVKRDYSILEYYKNNNK